MALPKRTALAAAILALVLAGPAARAQQAPAPKADEPPSLEGFWQFKAVAGGTTCPHMFGAEAHPDSYESPVQIEQRARTIRLRLEGDQAEGRIKGDTVTFVATNTTAMEACEVQSRSVMVFKIQGNSLVGTQKEYHLCDVMMPGVKCPFDQCTSDASVTLTRLATKEAYNTELASFKARVKKEGTGGIQVTREVARKALGDYCR